MFKIKARTINKTPFLLIKLFLLAGIFLFNSNPCSASGQESSTSALHPSQMSWEFEGFLGGFDRQSIQRGYQVYKEVCAACHSMKLLSYRNLEDIGFSPEEVKQIASEYSVTDGPNDNGEMYERPALPSDKFVAPFPNDQAARAAHGGALPPDLSLIIKARENGANYVYSLITGFTSAPEDFKLMEGKYYNPYFEGRQIGMPPPLADDGMVTYKDGTYASKEQMALDVVNFLQWASEQEMEQRKKMGIRTMIFLGVMLTLFVVAKRIIWQKVK